MQRWTTPDKTHSAHVGNRRITQVNGADGTMPFARCTCGWEGPGRLERPTAVQDIMDHLAKVTH